MSKFVVVDLEMCNVPRGLRGSGFDWDCEIIQIGAVVVNDELELGDSYMSYVAPEFGTVDPFIEKLTGISRRDVQGAPKLKQALEDFLKWLPEDCTLVSWSDNDEYQIRRELEEKGIEVEGLEPYLDSWIDCQYTFGEKMDADKSYRLSEALIIADIDYDDGEHDALVDAKNTAKLFIKMEKEPELVLNPYYTTGI